MFFMVQALLHKLEPNFSDAETINHSFISSRLDYCNSLFSCLRQKDLKRLSYKTAD